MKKLALALALAATFGGAQAATIDASTGGRLWVDNLGNSANNSVSFSGYDGQPVAYTGSQNQGFWGSLWALAGETVQFTYLGNESGYVNNFFSVGGNLFEFSNIGDTVSFYTASSQQLNFGFNDANTPASFSNGQQQGSILGFTIMKAAPNSAFDYYIGFNDGFQNDADYDDFVVGVSSVPVPAAGLLFGSALLGAVGFGRRKQNGVAAV